jgi:outer membrane murein-binding lipoprotein Lpp
MAIRECVGNIGRSTNTWECAMPFSRRRFITFAAVGVPAILAGCASTPSFSGDALMTTLTSGAGGLSQKQAAGGLGAVMSLAQTRLGGDFGQLAKLMPSAEKYLQVAKDAGLLDKPITNVAGLNAAFQNLGMDPMQAKGLLDAASSFASKQGGDAGRNLLARALAV